MSTAVAPARRLAAPKRWIDTVLGSPQMAALVDLVSLEMIASSPSRAELTSRRLGRHVGQLERIALLPRHSETAALLRSGRIDGFEEHTTLELADGSTVPVRYRARAVDTGRSERRYAVVLTEERPGTVTGSPLDWPTPERFVLIVTDRAWHIEWASIDVDAVLGFSLAELRGRPVLDLVDESQQADLATTITHVLAESTAVSLDLRVRHADGLAPAMSVLLAPRPTVPGAVAVIVAATPGATSTPKSDAVQRALLQLVLQVRRELADTIELPIPEEAAVVLAALPERQAEIVRRLRRGERVPGIAREMFLSQNTVRNHLSATFRKFGVHSQAALLARLRGTNGSSTGA